MTAVLLTHPAVAAERVCHDEQLQIWGHELFVNLVMEGAIPDDLTYQAQVETERVLRHEIKRIVGWAFTHPEAMKPIK